MAIPHAKPGEIVDVRPLGPALASAQTKTLVPYQETFVRRGRGACPARPCQAPQVSAPQSTGAPTWWHLLGSLSRRAERDSSPAGPAGEPVCRPKAKCRPGQVVRAVRRASIGNDSNRGLFGSACRETVSLNPDMSDRNSGSHNGREASVEKTRRYLNPSRLMGRAS